MKNFPSSLAAPRGNTLIITLISVVIMSVFFATGLSLTQHTSRNADRSRSLEEATQIGLGVLDVAFSRWRAISRANPGTAQPTSSFSGIPAVTAGQMNADTNFTLSNYSVQAVDPQLNPILSSATPPAATGQTPSARSFFYVASVDVSVPSVTGEMTARVRRILEQSEMSPWNYAIFYEDDLEIHPGPPFVVDGWVHTNKSLYTGHDTLTFGSKVSYVDNFVIGFKPGDDTHPEEPQSPNWSPDQPIARETSQLPFGQDPSTAFNTSDTNPNNDGYRELIEAPQSGYSDPLSNIRFQSQASVRIEINNSNQVTIRNGAGQVLTSSSVGDDKLMYDTFISAVRTNRSIQDNRESATVRLTDLEIDKIKAAYPTVPGGGFNGIVHISDTSADQNGGTPKRGVRLINGASLPVGGLTVASDNPIYIQGNYNTGGDLPPSNTGDSTKPTVNGYTRQPASVIGDAVTILSSSWNDANSGSGSTLRVADNTTVNTAILAGIVPTGSQGNNYSGGAENFPRFLENWDGKTFTYYGSMVQLYLSKQATGIWGKSNVYSPPDRNWYFDTRLRESPPPGTLSITRYNKQRWFLQ